LDFGLWTLDFGLWNLEFGIWNLVFGIWCLEFGVWSLEFGVWCVENINDLPATAVNSVLVLYFSKNSFVIFSLMYTY
jgi:hypothetical protein